MLISILYNFKKMIADLKPITPTLYTFTHN